MAPSAIAAVNAAWRARGSLSRRRSRCRPENSTSQNVSKARTSGSHTRLFLRRGERLADRVGDRALGPRVGLVAPDHERTHAPGSVLADPEAEPASPGSPNEMGALEPEPVEDRDRIGDAQRHRISRGVVRLVTATMAPVIRKDDAVALAPEGVDQGPFAQLL